MHRHRRAPPARHRRARQHAPLAPARRSMRTIFSGHAPVRRTALHAVRRGMLLRRLQPTGHARQRLGQPPLVPPAPKRWPLRTSRTDTHAAS
eukprot:5975808-Pleurochrysis_carterae.AAC.1